MEGGIATAGPIEDGLRSPVRHGSLPVPPTVWRTHRQDFGGAGGLAPGGRAGYDPRAGMTAPTRILFIDDEANLVAALVRHFERRGFAPTPAYLLSEAVQAIEDS